MHSLLALLLRFLWQIRGKKNPSLPLPTGGSCYSGRLLIYQPSEKCLYRQVIRLSVPLLCCFEDSNSEPPSSICALATNARRTYPVVADVCARRRQIFADVDNSLNISVSRWRASYALHKKIKTPIRNFGTKGHFLPILNHS